MFNPLKTRKPLTGIFANSEDPAICCISSRSALFAMTKLFFRERHTLFVLEIITGYPSIFSMDYPDFIVCSFMENSSGLKRVNECSNVVVC